MGLPLGIVIRRLFRCLSIILSVAVWMSASPARGADYVIQISVDGLGSSYLEHLMSLGEAPNFQRFLTEGSGTLNARTDYDYTITLPNHTSMLTGRPVLDHFDDFGSGHFWEENYDPGDPVTLHSNRGFYVASAFDVAHDKGLSTAIYSGKPKFEIYNRSYDADHGGIDLTGFNNGTDKIDVSVITDFDTEAMMTAFLSNMAASPTNYTFLHFQDPDSAGHGNGWGSEEYLASLRLVDAYLGEVFSLVAANPEMAGHTALVLTADHGGDIDYDHSDPTKLVDYTIPFFVWGDGVSPGMDLYGLNASTRLDPGSSRPEYSNSTLAPIRNGDSGNLSLDLLGLGAIPSSSINNEQNLVVAVPEPSASSYLIMLGLVFGIWRQCKARRMTGR
jgi:hypothetical protein